MGTYLFVFLEPCSNQLASFPVWRKELFREEPDLVHDLTLDADDEILEKNHYRHLDVYRSTHDASELVALLDTRWQDLSTSEHISAIHLQIYSQLTELRMTSLSAATIVSVGMTIADDEAAHEELGKWYREEHMPALATVLGWQAGIRLKLVKTFGKDLEYAAPYVALHEWLEPNDLGGDSWRKATLTPWLGRISEMQTAPTHRRVWKTV